MFEQWSLLEADWLREYHLDINEQVWGSEISWRRFQGLVQGLSQDSNWHASQKRGSRRLNDSREVAAANRERRNHYARNN